MKPVSRLFAKDPLENDGWKRVTDARVPVRTLLLLNILKLVQYSPQPSRVVRRWGECPSTWAIWVLLSARCSREAAAYGRWYFVSPSAVFLKCQTMGYRGIFLVTNYMYEVVVNCTCRILIVCRKHQNNGPLVPLSYPCRPKPNAVNRNRTEPFTSSLTLLSLPLFRHLSRCVNLCR